MLGACLLSLPWTLDRVGANGDALRQSVLWRDGDDVLPGLGREFMEGLRAIGPIC